jgi:hypothetical protein
MASIAKTPLRVEFEMKKKVEDIVCTKANCHARIATLFEERGKLDFVVHAKQVGFTLIDKPTYLFSIQCPRCGDRQKRNLRFFAFFEKGGVAPTAPADAVRGWPKRLSN